MHVTKRLCTAKQGLREAQDALVSARRHAGEDYIGTCEHHVKRTLNEVWYAQNWAKLAEQANKGEDFTA